MALFTNWFRKSRPSLNIPREFADQQALEIEQDVARRIAVWRRRNDDGLHDLPIQLGGLGLTAVPEALREIPNIRHLVLDYNDIEALPYWIGDLYTLISVDLTNNKL